jgi:hypothetical protein
MKNCVIGLLTLLACWFSCTAYAQCEDASKIIQKAENQAKYNLTVKVKDLPGGAQYADYSTFSDVATSPRFQ